MRRGPSHEDLRADAIEATAAALRAELERLARDSHAAFERLTTELRQISAAVEGASERRGSEDWRYQHERADQRLERAQQQALAIVESARQEAAILREQAIQHAREIEHDAHARALMLIEHSRIGASELVAASEAQVAQTRGRVEHLAGMQREIQGAIQSTVGRMQEGLRELSTSSPFPVRLPARAPHVTQAASRSGVAAPSVAATNVTASGAAPRPTPTRNSTPPAPKYQSPALVEETAVAVAAATADEAREAAAGNAAPVPSIPRSGEVPVQAAPREIPTTQAVQPRQAFAGSTAEYVLQVSPIFDFPTLMRFERAISSLPGLRDSFVLSFDDDVADLHLSVGGDVDPMALLAQIQGFSYELAVGEDGAFTARGFVEDQQRAA